MKKMVIAMIIMLLLTVLIVGCTKVEKAVPESINQSRFMEVESVVGLWRIVVDRETGVMYAVSFGGYNRGSFTLLVDADGNPLIYKGEQDD